MRRQSVLMVGLFFSRSLNGSLRKFSGGKMSILTKMMSIVFAAICVCGPVNAADKLGRDTDYSVSDQQFKGFITVAPGRELFVDIVKAAPGNPTVFLLNGLTYTTEQWNDFVPYLLKNKIGVVRIDLYGMGQSLILKSGPVVSSISYESQVENLKSLIEILQIKGPYNLLGLSYGGAIAMAFAKTYPTLVKELILMAPFTKPVVSQDTWIRSQIWLTRKINPSIPYSDDDLYDIFLRQLVYTTFPSAEPIILTHPFKIEGVYRLVQGVRKFIAADVVDKFPAKSVHLMIGVKDQYIEAPVFAEFWNSLPTKSRASLLVINDSEHKIPQHVPDFSAGWVYHILTGNKLLKEGYEFTGDPKTGQVSKDGQKVLELPRGFKYGYL